MLARSLCKDYARPLLPIEKESLISYMNLRNFEWSEDLSNHERKYKRNNIRLDLIPIMENLAGGPVALRK